MAITYPRDLRDYENVLLDASLTLRHNATTVQMRGGAFSMDLGPGRWLGSFATIPLPELRRRPVEAMIDSLSGGRTFLAYDRMKCYPAKHPGGAISGAWLNALVVEHVTATTIRCHALNAALRLTAGDLVGLEASGKYSLHRVLADAQPSANLITLDVAPVVPVALFPAGSTLRLVRPVCPMILDPSKPMDAALGQWVASLSFSGIQAVL